MYGQGIPGDVCSPSKGSPHDTYCQYTALAVGLNGNHCSVKKRRDQRQRLEANSKTRMILALESPSLFWLFRLVCLVKEYGGITIDIMKKDGVHPYILS